MRYSSYRYQSCLVKQPRTDAEYVTINPTSRFSNSFSHTSVR